MPADDHVLYGTQYPQHGAVVHGGRSCSGGWSARVRTAFERVAIGVEQRSPMAIGEFAKCVLVLELFGRKMIS